MNLKERWLNCYQCKQSFIGVANRVDTICPDCRMNLLKQITKNKKESTFTVLIKANRQFR